MKFYDAITSQRIKVGHSVCGDYYLCEKQIDGTLYIVCDGIGSGIYANIAAISCASRLREHVRNGVSLRVAVEMTAASMHRARSERIPFAAFSAVFIHVDGNFDVYTYEAPEAIMISKGYVRIMKPTFFSAGYEVVGEASGMLELGDSIILSTDGITQAGMGHGLNFGIGIEEVAKFTSRYIAGNNPLEDLPTHLTDMCASVSAGQFEDDTTSALIVCRSAAEITILTGPPLHKARDRDCIRDFMAMPGTKIVIGSTTIDILARETGRGAVLKHMSTSFSSPPEYEVEGIDLATEGAVMLNQVYNILGEEYEGDNDDAESNDVDRGVVERFCAMLLKADVIHFFIGDSLNEAHSTRIFKQMGILPRKQVVTGIIAKLRRMGKLVTEKSY